MYSSVKLPNPKQKNVYLSKLFELKFGNGQSTQVDRFVLKVASNILLINFPYIFIGYYNLCQDVIDRTMKESKLVQYKVNGTDKT